MFILKKSPLVNIFLKQKKEHFTNTPFYAMQKINYPSLNVQDTK